MSVLAVLAAAQAHHENWLKDRRAQGWTYGEVHDGVKKRNPYLLEFDDLPDEQRQQEVAGVSGTFAVLGISPDISLSELRSRMSVEPEVEAPSPPRDFGWAIRELKGGGRVCRSGWNGKGQWLELQTGEAGSKMTLPYIYIHTVQGDLVPWLASQTDMLTTDWAEVAS